MNVFKTILMFVACAFGACVSKADDKVDVVDPLRFQAELKADTTAYLLDVRTPDEYAESHLAGAHNLDWLNEAEFKRDAAGIDKAKTVYVYCRSGRRSNAAASYLLGEGYKVVDLEGGILGWIKAGLPVEEEK